MRDTNIEDSDLAGENKKNSSWEKGFNGVYKNITGPGFRVSLKTESGWVTFGCFHNLNTAAYVANVAILATNSEGKYKLNKNARPDKKELVNWLHEKKENKLMHSSAKDKFLEDAALEFPKLSGLNITEQYIENIRKGRYSIEQLQDMKQRARPDGPISSAIDDFIRSRRN